MNLLIVESENDEFFVQALLEYIHQTTTDVCSIDVFKHSSLSKKKLITQLESAFTEVVKQGNSKIGVILDLDADTIINRLELVNECLNAALKNTFDRNLKVLIQNTN